MFSWVSGLGVWVGCLCVLLGVWVFCWCLGRASGSGVWVFCWVPDWVSGSGVWMFCWVSGSGVCVLLGVWVWCLGVLLGLLLGPSFWGSGGWSPQESGESGGLTLFVRRDGP